MLEIEQLESQWRRYKLKRAMPLFVSFGFIILIALGLFFWPNIQSFYLSSKKSVPQHSEKVVKPKPNKTTVATEKTSSSIKNETLPVPDETKRPIQKVNQKPMETKTPKIAATPQKSEETSVVLNPDTAFLSSFNHPENKNLTQKKNDIVKHETIAAVPHETKKTIDQKSTEKKEALKKQNDFPKKAKDVQKNSNDLNTYEENVKPSQSSNLIIQTKQTNNTLEYLIERFNTSRDPKLATYIAQSFYKKGNYQETVKWSVIANSIEPSNEESWLLFARAKVKLGQKEDAINALQIYLNQYSSRRVKSYLQSLKEDL